MHATLVSDPRYATLVSDLRLCHTSKRPSLDMRVDKLAIV